MAMLETISVEVFDRALNAQRSTLFQAMGIVALATATLRGSSGKENVTNAWTALEGAYAIMDGVAGRLEDVETLLRRENVNG